MAIERVEPHDVGPRSVEMLGLAANRFDVVSTEAIAASVRRAASFLCPTTPGRLVRAVTEVLAGLSGFGDETKGEVESVIESLVAYGDLLELPLDHGHGKRRHIFLAPPAYVERGDRWLLVGVRPEGAPLLDEQLERHVEYARHVRFVRTDDWTSASEHLAAHAVSHLSQEHWLGPPRQVEAKAFVASYAVALSAAGPAGDIEELTILDPALPVTYYRGRWRPVKPTDDGRFVARRPQAFGSPLWCFVEVVSGEPAALIDLPLQAPLSPGADEGLRLQAALDAVAGRPQPVRVAKGATGTRILDLFSPVPSWVQRRLDVLGHPRARSRGALFSYELPEAEVRAEVEFLQNMMWYSGEMPTSGASRGP